MSRSTEDLLRSALRARADAITDDRLTDRRPIGEILSDEPRLGDTDEATSTDDSLDAAEAFDALDDLSPAKALSPRPRRLGRHGRWTRPLLAAAAAVAIVAGAAAVTGSLHAGRHSPADHTNAPSPIPESPEPTPDPTPTPATTPTATPAPAAPAMLSAGQQGTRDQIPWSLVGPGWTLATWSAQTFNDNLDGTMNETMFLVDPLGGRYSIAAINWSGAQLLAWSPDGKRALFDAGGDAQNTNYREIDLTTGTSRSLDSRYGDFLSYTRPNGTALIVGGRGHGVNKIGLDGQLQARYQTGDDPSLDPRGIVFQPDGSTFFIGTSTGVVELGNDTGATVATFSDPPGAGDCTLQSRWDDTHVLINCTQGSATDSANRVVYYVLDTIGGSFRLFDIVPPGPPYIYRLFGSSTAAVARWATSPSYACSTQVTARLIRNGTVTDLSVTAPTGVTTSSAPVEITGSKVLLTTNLCSQGEGFTTLFSYDLDTAQTIPLLGPGANGGGVISLQPYPTR